MHHSCRHQPSSCFLLHIASCFACLWACTPTRVLVLFKVTPRDVQERG